jgi:hypothetical protein
VCVAPDVLKESAPVNARTSSQGSDEGFLELCL